MAGYARLRERLARPVPLFRYLLATTETHAFCGALAFFALLAFYPASSLLLSLAKHALPWLGTHRVVVQALAEYYPEAQGFLLRNLEVSVAQHGRRLDVASAFWILLGAAGVFVPLESAFNRLWRAREHRPYWKNQLVGFLLTAACSALAVAFVLLTSALHWAIGRAAPSLMLAVALKYAAFRVVALGFSVVAIFLFYRFLPNGPVRSADVLPAALCAGVAGELLRALFLLALPALELQKSQGPYYVSVSFVLLVYFEAFVLLGGAYLAAEPAEEADASSTPRTMVVDVAAVGETHQTH